MWLFAMIATFDNRERSMSGANWVAVVSVIFTSLTAGYATYENNQTNKVLEKLKQESTLSIERIRQEQSVALENLKSAKERESLLQDRDFQARSKYCNDALAIYKQLGDATIAAQDIDREVRSPALKLKSKLQIQALAYLDDSVYQKYLKTSANITDPADNTMIASLAIQVRRCAAMKPVNAQH